MYNILSERLIRVDLSDGSREEASLPEVYAALMADTVEAFPALRPHQRHAWHAFLVQLGAMAVREAGLPGPPAVSGHWRRIIRGLTPEWPCDEPWQLVVDDITEPAFMQPPASSVERAADFKNTVETPDELDMLVTSKNHDVKSSVAIEASYDDVTFSLVTLQTSEGFGGAGNYGISRMNGGLGSRPAFSVTPSTRFGAHVRRDVAVLLERRDDLLGNSPAIDGGICLLWTEAWDGTKAEALLINALDPLYIESCRRIRIRREAGGRLSAIRATSKAARIEAKALNGVTGDPWTPVDPDGAKSLTLAGGGFTYKRTVDYLVQWNRPLLCEPTATEIQSSDKMQLVARAMVRGQGKTEGYYERTIPIRKSLGAAMMRRGGGTGEFGRIANGRIEDVGKIQRILSHAIQAFLARGEADNASPEQRGLARPWLNRLDETVDARFFEDVQTELEAPAGQRGSIRNRWLRDSTTRSGVIEDANSLLEDAMGSLPCPAAFRYKARQSAESLFWGRLRSNNGLPGAFDDGSEGD